MYSLVCTCDLYTQQMDKQVNNSPKPQTVSSLPCLQIPHQDGSWSKQAKTLEVQAHGIQRGNPSAVTFTQIPSWSLWEHLPGSETSCAWGLGIEAAVGSY